MKTKTRRQQPQNSCVSTVTNNYQSSSGAQCASVQWQASCQDTYI